MGVLVAIGLLSVAGGNAADFDGDGVADQFAITRETAKMVKDSTIRLVNPWHEAHPSTNPPKGLGFLIRLSGGRQRFLLHDSIFFNTPAWMQGKPPVEIITKQDRRYSAWKKQVAGLRNDAIQLGTEAGIDILLYWAGKRWRLFWPDEEP